MSEKYIIKIYDISSHRSGMRINYFYEEAFTENTYIDTPHTRDAKKLTKEQAQKTIKNIEKAHKNDPENGILDHIEILDADTLEIIDSNKIEEISRFELMDFEE